MKTQDKRLPVETRWCVLTGAPCSGKTTTLLALETLGHKWIPEFARLYIDAELAKGRTIEELRADEAAFQSGLTEAKARIESELDPRETVFLDRAMPDGITYYRLAGLDPAAVIELSKRFLYHRVFILDRLPFEQDGARTESDLSAEFLDRELELDYRQLGYDVIRIPICSVEERVQMIIERIDA